MTRNRFLPLALVLAVGSLQPLHAQQRARGPARVSVAGIAVSGFTSNALHFYRGADSRPLGSIPVPGAQSIARGPAGRLYVCAEAIDEVLRFDPRDPTSLVSFVADDPLTPEDESGGLDGPTGAIFGPDGNLYVASFEGDSILRFDGETGAYLDVFVPPGAGGLDGPDAGLEFGPDGHLYVPSYWNHRVLRYDGSTGASLGDFVPAGLGGLRNPRDVAFRDGFVFVASSTNNRVLRYDAGGAFVDRFINVPSPYHLQFHPVTGDLLVVNLNRNNVRIHDRFTGEFKRLLVGGGAGGLSGATFVHVLR